MLSLSHFGSQRVAMAPERGGYLTVTQHRPLRSLKMALRYRTVNLGRNAQPPISVLRFRYDEGESTRMNLALTISLARGI